ncbi:MAG TPA: hypothetical protein VJI32_07545, partial [Candidatus Nanoarchaeia archaeon]|nr:hypothetical protein [Candidatus Nanoarchaeia archaeon]
QIDYGNETLCYGVASGRWKVPEDVCEDARNVASTTLDGYLKKLGIQTNALGIAMARCIPKEVAVPGGRAYEASAGACVSFRMHDPYTVDRVLEDVDPVEGQLAGHTFNGYTHIASQSTSVTSGFSEEGYGRTVQKDKSTPVVENYSVTNRALPWVTALSGLLEKTGFDDKQKGNVWKWAAGDEKVLKKQGVKSVYEMLLDEMKKQKK